MILAIMVAVMITIVGGMFYLMLLAPFQAIENAMANQFPESIGLLNNLNTLYVWAPVFIILIPLMVYLVIKAMEERVRGDVYP